jgi:transcriptional regulator with XRE-family HTH domain
MRISREEFNQAIGAALSALRVERGFSQAEVAEGINEGAPSHQKTDVHWKRESNMTADVIRTRLSKIDRC